MMTDKFSPTRFGEKLRKLRKFHNVTLVNLANALGYTSHGYLSEIENGKKAPTIELVLKVSGYFDVSTDDLLKDDREIMLSNEEEDPDAHTY